MDQLLGRPAAKLCSNEIVLLSRVLIARMRRPVDADMPQVVETQTYGAVPLSERPVNFHLERRYGGALEQARGAEGQPVQALLGWAELVHDVVAFGSGQLQVERERMPLLPGLLGQQGCTVDGIQERRAV